MLVYANNVIKSRKDAGDDNGGVEGRKEIKCNWIHNIKMIQPAVGIIKDGLIAP